jgi:uncharacterized protein
VRVLLDANILISYLLTARATSPIHAVVRAAFSGAYTLLLPDAVLEEVARTARASAYLARRLTLEEISALADLLRPLSEPIPIITAEFPELMRDPKDDYLLAYAVVGQADYLVTGDRDLLTLGEVEGVRIVSPATFVALLATEGQVG